MTKVVCLHGWGASGEFMRHQMRNFSKLFPEIEFDCMSGPIPIAEQAVRTDPPVRKNSPSKKFHAWKENLWDEVVTEGKLDFSKGIDGLIEYMNKNGPFDGICGFSMGGIVAQHFIELYEKGKLGDKLKVACPKFIMFVSSNNMRISQDLVSIPSVHFVGKRDFISDVTSTLSPKFLNPLVILHDGGHQFPKLNETEIDAVRQYLAPVIGKYKGRVYRPKL